MRLRVTWREESLKGIFVGGRGSIPQRQDQEGERNEARNLATLTDAGVMLVSEVPCQVASEEPYGEVYMSW